MLLKVLNKVYESTSEYLTRHSSFRILKEQTFLINSLQQATDHLSDKNVNLPSSKFREYPWDPCESDSARPSAASSPSSALCERCAAGENAATPLRQACRRAATRAPDDRHRLHCRWRACCSGRRYRARARLRPRRRWRYWPGPDRSWGRTRGSSE